MLNKGVNAFYKLLGGAILLMIVLSMITANLGWFGMMAIYAVMGLSIAWLVRRHAADRAEIRRLEGELRRTAYWQRQP